MNLFGNEPMPPQQVTQFRRSGEEPQNSSMMAMMAALEEEKRKRQMQGVLSLVGLAALSGGIKNGELGMGNGGEVASSVGSGMKMAGAAGKTPPAPPVAAPQAKAGGVMSGKAKAGGRSRRASGAAASKPAAVASKIFPMGMMGAGTAAASGGLMNSPMAVAGLAGGLELVGGLMGGGGDQEQLAKDQLRSSRQMNLFDGVRAMTDGIRQRSQEMRAALAGLGR